MKTAETTLKRTFNAPLARVWQAWTDPKEIQKWWGPKGFTNPECEWNPVPGEKIYIVMRAPDGNDYPMDGTFTEVTKESRLVFSARALDKDGKPMFSDITTVTFAEVDGKTEMTLHAVVENVTPEIAVFTDGMEEGWSQSLEKLKNLFA